ncbi:ParB/RepB/Spo0J family partition protein [Bacillus anthracis]|uniref:ParB/RepB/Spo0J family partition protein n=1 Tax=Bacillus TaxID=1386 RepID=UPI0010651872|nr:MULTISPECIES: ParB/RepB/Spo0J family partition protein [Bacillus]MCU5690509.1 ParB/RepB/Spo0J family partition protein [Bacillus cereus]MEB9908978.1 ParB/RepB/Spo0J family partition protein [Bacillus anthracis]MEC1955703.1 ParB/RepB/Spo0J family partition protein [Bacillus anthracis]TEA50176.1 ParB/RepB/Spo0J family partition protein [Bacillus sp. BH2]TXR67642.1 hypothetical protein DN395_02075 [Bacillus sp. AR18-7]
MKGVIRAVNIKEIVPIYVESVPKTVKGRMMNCIKNGEGVSILPKVEKSLDGKKYYLISGYIAYEAYKSVGKQYIDCIVSPLSNETEQTVLLLQSMFQVAGVNWMDKSILIFQLLEKGLDIDKIARRVGVKKQDLERYLIHSEIPPEIANKAYDLQCIPLVDKVRRLRVTYSLKYRLYEKAVLNKRGSERLTHDKLEKIKWLLNSTSFNELYDMELQWEHMLDMMNYKKLLINQFQSKIERQLSQWGTPSDDDDFPSLPN